MPTTSFGRKTGTEVAGKAAFTDIRYAQCWEDADVLLAGLDIRPGEICLSIASGGDNSLAMLTRDPARVIAIDLSPAQLACLALRVAAYRALNHSELLELMGSRPSDRRLELYRRCCAGLESDDVRAFWDRNQGALAAHGLGGVGKFEHYFGLFRRYILPLVHSSATVRGLLASKPRAVREDYYTTRWNSWRWRLLVRAFFSKVLMGLLGRDPAFFDYVHGSVAEHVLRRSRHAATVLDPAKNPYLHWILTGRHGAALPLALRAENFATIRNRLDRLEWSLCSIEEFVEAAKAEGRFVDKFNLSDVFEYMSEDNYRALLADLLDIARPAARLLYWNMMAPRSRPDAMADRLQPLDALAERLFAADKAFFYSRINIEQVR